MRRLLQTVNQTTGSISSNAQGASVTLGRAETASAAVVITGSGTGSVQFQLSNDNTSWVNYGSPVSISGAGNLYLEIVNPSSLYVRLSFIVSTGSYNASSTITCKGDES